MMITLFLVIYFLLVAIVIKTYRSLILISEDLLIGGFSRTNSAPVRTEEVIGKTSENKTSLVLGQKDRISIPAEPLRLGD